MKYLVQLFKSAKHIEKPEYITEVRNEVGNFKNILSKTGFLSENTIFLPEKLNSRVSNQNNLIIIQDIKGLTHSDKQQYSDNFHQGQNQCTFELFEFRILESTKLEIWFKYNPIIGLPKRENHKIAELSAGEYIRFKINGMHDFTLTGRKQRTFSEFDFIIQFAGTAKNIEYMNSHKLEVLKLVSNVECKIINERKILP